MVKELKGIFGKSIFNKRSDTIYVLTLIFMCVLLFVTFYSYRRGGFFNYSTDDILQYYPFMANFIESLKSGDLSLFDLSNFAGSSIFADAYYIPLDIFTFLTLVLSFIFKTETAYSIVNILKPILASYLMFYVLLRKGLSNKTSFFASLIYFSSGITQCYFVFPVYLGINFYIPLAMLFVDKFLEDKNYFFLITIFTIIVIFYDFYLSYMLLAFLMIYLLTSVYMQDDFSLFKKNTFIINKKFYSYLITSIILILIGLMISMVVFLPSFNYIINDTFRQTGTYDLFKFDKDHYFTIFLNYFLPNEPHRLMLIGPGDYVKEHISFYQTILGFIFLCYFFSFKESKYRRLQLVVIVLNILSLFPIFSMIFSGNKVPYVRWFFIVFTFNFLAMCYAMDKDDLKIKCGIITNVIIRLVLITALSSFIYVFFFDDSLSIHMKKNDEIFLILLIPMILLGLYIVLFDIINKDRFKLLRYGLLSIEIIASIILIFGFSIEVNKYYYIAEDRITAVNEMLIRNTDYKGDGVYRVHLDDWSSKRITNTSKIAKGFNIGSYFHSFYDADLNDLFTNVLRSESSSWNRKANDIYNLYTGSLFNNKYIVVNAKEEPYFPTEYYEKVYTGTHSKYNETNTYVIYELKDDNPFIVYDKVITSLESIGNMARLIETVMRYGYLDAKNLNVDIDKFNVALTNELNLKCKARVNYMYSDVTVENIDGNNYFVYNIPYTFQQSDMLMAYSLSSSIRSMAFEEYFILDKEGNQHEMHCNVAYLDNYIPDKLYIRVDDTTLFKGLDLYSISYSGYDIFLEEQSNYQNKIMELNGNKLHLSYETEAKPYKTIIKLPYTYSDNWVIAQNGYEVINVSCGFLGIVVPENTMNVNLDLEFIPKGLNSGIIISSIGIGVFAFILIIYFLGYKKLFKKYYRNEVIK